MARDTKKGSAALERRQRAFDALPQQAKDGRKRPGSTNAHKGLR